jgi:hypothetical protein
MISGTWMPAPITYMYDAVKRGVGIGAGGGVNRGVNGAAVVTGAVRIGRVH